MIAARGKLPKFFHCDESVTCRDMFETVTNILSEFGMDLMNCRGQGYDGAGATVGKVNSLSGILFKSNNWIYKYTVIVTG